MDYLSASTCSQLTRLLPSDAGIPFIKFQDFVFLPFSEVRTKSDCSKLTHALPSDTGIPIPFIKFQEFFFLSLQYSGDQYYVLQAEPKLFGYNALVVTLAAVVKRKGESSKLTHLLKMQ